VRGSEHGGSKDDRMRALYFAWVRERIGKAEEEIAPPENITTVGELMGWLHGQGENYAAAFAHIKTMRAAIDRVHVKHDALIGTAREIAFFPPMTGG
jgi:molybdopterin synthase sulfur carrier subunit